MLAGGGARGAYEAGVLAELLPALPVHQRPNIIVGASVGAVNGAYIGATRGEDPQLIEGQKLWEELGFGDVMGSPSVKDLKRLTRGIVNFTGLLSLHVPSILDTTPLGPTLDRVIPFERFTGRQRGVTAVVATSARTGRSVVFHAGGTPDTVRDDKRGIDYVQTPLTEAHVRASSAIPALFPAVQLADGDWYFDGSTRLNAPIKPALAFGAKRVIVIGLNSISTASNHPLGGSQRPDLAAGAALVLDALLSDPLTEDLQTLTTINRLAGPDRQVPYIFVAPPERDTIGQIARDVFRKHYGGLLHVHRSPQLAFLGRLIDADADPLHGELLSYLFFAPEFARALVARGRADARAWLAEPHDDGLWDLGPLGRER